MRKTSDAILGMHILEIEITSRCNLNCLHCYNRSEKDHDLPLDKIKSFFYFAKKYKVSTLVISGGEARMHPEFKKLCNFLKKQKRDGIRLVLQTNGTMIGDDFIDITKIFDTIHISFDPSNLVRLNSSANLLLAKKLLQQGISSYLFTTLHRGNYKNLTKIINLANKNEVPIGFNVCLPTKKQGNELAVPLKDFFALEKKLFNFSREGKILRYSGPLTAIFSPEKKIGYSGNRGGCIAGIASCVISFNGDVYACPFFRVSAGNIFNTSLLNIWKKSELFNLIRDRKKYHDPCGHCSYLSYCGGCRNRALKLNGDVLSVDPFCHLIKNSDKLAI